MNEPKRLGTHWVAVALALGVTGCGGGGSSAPALTPQEQLAQLEASGALPTLKRGDGIAGTDANANGVRDDIERYIEKKYTLPVERAAAMQMARAYQQMLLVDKRDLVALDKVSAAAMRGVNCVSLVYSSIEEFTKGHKIATEIEAITTNTKQRLLAYLAYNKARSGSVSRLPEGDTCD